MRLVVVETPFRHGGDREVRRLKLRYVRAAMHDCFMRGEAPFASHALYTQPGVLEDEIPEQRELGTLAGFAWKDIADATVVYGDLGITDGMALGIVRAERLGHDIEYRTVLGWVSGVKPT